MYLPRPGASGRRLDGPIGSLDGSPSSSSSSDDEEGWVEGYSGRELAAAAFESAQSLSSLAAQGTQDALGGLYGMAQGLSLAMGSWQGQLRRTYGGIAQQRGGGLLVPPEGEEEEVVEEDGVGDRFVPTRAAVEALAASVLTADDGNLLSSLLRGDRGDASSESSGTSDVQKNGKATGTLADRSPSPSRNIVRGLRAARDAAVTSTNRTDRREKEQPPAAPEEVVGSRSPLLQQEATAAAPSRSYDSEGVVMFEGFPPTATGELPFGPGGVVVDRLADRVEVEVTSSSWDDDDDFTDRVTQSPAQRRAEDEVLVAIQRAAKACDEAMLASGALEKALASASEVGWSPERRGRG